MIRFFIIDWILDYINTPKYEMTVGTEVLFYAALLIIFAVIIGIIFLIDFIYNKVKKY